MFRNTYNKFRPLLANANKNMTFFAKQRRHMSNFTDEKFTFGAGVVGVYATMIYLCSLIGGAGGLYKGYQSTKELKGTQLEDTSTVIAYTLSGFCYGAGIGITSPITVPIILLRKDRK
jgi:hypothetical protein